jgi:recombination protein RecA
VKGAALIAIKKLIDAGVITVGTSRRPTELLPTGIEALDELLTGGIPLGQITEIYGPYGTGKSTIAYHVLAANRKLKRVDVGLKRPVNAVFVDTEGSFDAERAVVIGARPKRMALVTPDYGEQALDAALAFVETGIKLMVVDSLRGLVPVKVISESVEDDNVALLARMFAKFFPRFVLMKRKPALLCVNQVISRIGVPQWADPYTTPGGHAVKHLAYLRLEVKRRGTMKLKDKPVGQEVAVRITKSKYCAPMRDATLHLLYDRGYVTQAEWDKLRKVKGVEVVDG